MGSSPPFQQQSECGDTESRSRNRGQHHAEGVGDTRFINETELMRTRPPAEKRKLLDFVLSNCRWKDGQLEAEYRKPFDILAVAVAAQNGGGAGSAQDVAENENWLPERNSVTNLFWRNRFWANTKGYQLFRLPSKRTGCGFQWSKTRQHL